MQIPCFNILDEKWIPCILLHGDGMPVLLSLRHILAESHRVRELYLDSPLTTASLYRLLLAVLHRVFGPKDLEAWKDLWEKGKWDERTLEEYYQRWHEHFYLFHDQWPFYQVVKYSRGIKNIEKHSAAVLSIELASGNNPTLFDHRIDEEPVEISLAEAAQRLVTDQAYSIAGGVSHKDGDTKVLYADSPCMRGAFFFIEGQNLFETLILNMRRYPDENSRLPDDPGMDYPAWEIEPESNFNETKKIPNGYLNFLTWQSRQIKLIPAEKENGVFVSQVQRIMGRVIDKENVRDPLKSFRSDKEGHLYVRGFNSEKALWRDSEALFNLGETYSAPENFKWVSQLVDDDFLKPETQFRFQALGLATEGEVAAVKLWRNERMPLPLIYLKDPAAVSFLHDALNRAERAGRAVRQSAEWFAWMWVRDKNLAGWGPDQNLISIFRKWLDSKEYKQPQKYAPDYSAFRERFPVERDYWWRLEQPFQQLLPRFACEDEDQAMQAVNEWCNEICQAAQIAWNITAEKLEANPRTLRVRARAEVVLRVQLADAINPKRQEGDSDVKDTDSNLD